jgi:hypothetical protein
MIARGPRLQEDLTHELATSIAKGLVAACPAGTSAADESACNDCASRTAW